ncbi:O-antigen export protein [Hyunsoonleella aestuarii]|uniref:O-antigen export protein n=1 Tax=Hyunsoonleella aestuarii TaxID=912802 RepID=A0ABP8E919_9FLAO
MDNENYGIWLTLSSVIGWFTFFDIGLGNGLRNRLTEALTVGDFRLARAYVSSAYFTILAISLFLFLFFLLINNFIDWTLVFNTSSGLQVELSILMPIVTGCFCLQLVVKLIGNIYLASQNHSIQVKIHFFTQILSLIIIWILIKTTTSSLLIFGAIFSIIPVLVLLGLNIIGFSKKYIELRPTFSLWRYKYLKDIMGIGFEFFIIQISGIMLFATDNFIISNLFSPEEVVPYNVAFKYFSIPTMIFTIILTPYWSSFTEAYVKEDFQWIKKSIKSILKLWCLIPILLIIMLTISDWFYKIWIGEKVMISFVLSSSMAIYVLLFTFKSVFNFFINGVGKIRVQMIVGVISLIINIPLSILFAKYLDFGLSGVILATTVSVAMSAILGPLQYYKIINFKASGIWNR